MKILLSVFILPYEIDDLEMLVGRLKDCSYRLDGACQWTLDVTMCLSEDIINWRRSTLPKSYFLEKFQKISTCTDWCDKKFNVSTDIKGVVGQRRRTLNLYSDVDAFVWADADIIFCDELLKYIQDSLFQAAEFGSMFVISPELVRLWDSTWDCLVNENFINEPVGYQATNDPFRDCGVKGRVTLDFVNCGVPGQPKFKFGGGFFTTFSAPLLQRIGIPESFGHYGLEDTFIMWASEKLIQERGEKIYQHKMKNLVVCENYKYRNYNHLTNHLTIYNRKEEFRKMAEKNFKPELAKIT